ncbi:MAG: hypothetical protein KJO11_08860 [Gemmatimonadetes bacterium]|nr:hypothetical protein [Gemmatimonadota bacterium]NNK63666.1 hypothetical protein [Gemmatimonadota bacterium]
MLLRMETLEAIRQGRVTVQFRRWRRPTVRTGGTLRTPLGVLEIREVSEVSLDAIGIDDARRAGVRKLKALGLTESLEVGYRLSPRGAAVLRRLAGEPSS